MNRREFLAVGAGATVATDASLLRRSTSAPNSRPNDWRGYFPRLSLERYINAAGGTPLGTFAQAGLQRYMEFQRLGPCGGREDYVTEMRTNIRGLVGQFIGANASEIALVHSTKAGEQIVIDGLDPKGNGRNIVTNDMHFSGSLHNLIGLRRSGADVRIVTARNWDVSLDEMADAIDSRTALVAVALISNINGRVEPLRELAEIAHSHGALVYADIIQAAGVVPINVRELGIDFAACNGYKWLCGVHGAGFLFVREELQGSALPDRLFPGHVRYNYSPWIRDADPREEALIYTARTDASRYEPGHVSYLGYCAVYEGLAFLDRVGLRQTFDHSVRLCRRLKDQLDADQYECISPHVDRSPIIAFIRHDGPDLEERLRAAGLIVTLTGNRVRVSPAIYNTDEDIDMLAEVMNA